MTPESIPDRAATLVNQRNEAEAAIDAVKHLDGDWTAYALLVRDIVNGAHEHLNQANGMLDRVRALARNEAARLKGKK